MKVYADNTDWLHFQTGAARLLPRLIGARTRGPLFLADRRPVPARAPATIDRCPETGRGRLSYRRAEALFREASGGSTLHQLRHSALTYAAEDGTNLALLLARSAHASVRFLERYARPDPRRSPATLPRPIRRAADRDTSGSHLEGGRRVRWQQCRSVLSGGQQTAGGD